MNFLLKQPLDDARLALLESCVVAHAESAMRGNASSEGLKLGYLASGDVNKALIAALSTLGERHGPIRETYALLENDTERKVWAALEAGEKVVGWGNSFVRGEPDGLWGEVAERLKAYPIHGVIDMVTEILQGTGRKIFPNPSCYTAGVGIACGMSARACQLLFVASRLPAWCRWMIDAEKE